MPALWEEFACACGDQISEARVLALADDVQFVQPICGSAPCRCATRLASLCLTVDDAVSTGHKFWNHLPSAVRTAAIEIVRDEAGKSFLQILNRLQSLTPETNRASRRTSFRALKKIFPEQYWPDHFFVQAIASDRWKFRAVTRLLSLYPALIGEISAVLLTASDLDRAPSDLKVAFVSLARRSLGELLVVNWGAIFVANVLRAFAEPQLAFRALSLACEPHCDKHIRFEGLRLMANLVQPGPIGNFAALRCLVTALRVFPDHVRSGELLASISEKLLRVPNVTLARDTAAYATGRFDALSLDGQIDISEDSQAWLQLPHFMTDREKAPFYRTEEDTPPARSCFCHLNPPRSLDCHTAVR